MIEIHLDGEDHYLIGCNRTELAAIVAEASRVITEFPECRSGGLAALVEEFSHFAGRLTHRTNAEEVAYVESSIAAMPDPERIVAATPRRVPPQTYGRTHTAELIGSNVDHIADELTGRPVMARGTAVMREDGTATVTLVSGRLTAHGS